MDLGSGDEDLPSGTGRQRQSGLGVMKSLLSGLVGGQAHKCDLGSGCCREP